MRLVTILLLFVLTVSSSFLWGRSHTIMDKIDYGNVKIGLCHGRMLFLRTTSQIPRAPVRREPWNHDWYSYYTYPISSCPINKIEPHPSVQVPGSRTELLGIITLTYRDGDVGFDHHLVIIRMWWSLAFAVPLTFLVTRQVFGWRRRRAWRAAGRCECGYDLTGNKSGTCPECGKVSRIMPLTIKQAETSSSAPDGS
jgi:hypothetical protein